MPLARVEIVEGDTGAVPFGTGTFGSRSIAVGGSALHRAADRVLDKARAIAAHMLEAATDDIAFEDGVFLGRRDRPARDLRGGRRARPCAA